MRILSVVQKDLKIYLRQKKTLLLIILCPVSIMLLVGSIFSGAPEGGLKGVTLGISGSDTPLGKAIVESLSKEGMFTIAGEPSLNQAEIEKRVKSGEYSAGIILPVGENDTMKLFIDNSKLQVAPVVSTVFITVTEKLSFELTLEFIENLWTSLQEMESQMTPLGSEVVRVRDNIFGINEDAKKIKTSLEQLNVNKLNSSVIQMKETLESMKLELDNTRNELNTTRKEILDLDYTISAINGDAGDLKNQLGIVVANINTTDTALFDLRMSLGSIYNTTCLNQTLDPSCISISITLGQIDGARDLIHNRTSSIVALYDNLGKVVKTSEDLRSKLAEMDARLQKMDNSTLRYIEKIGGVEGDITDVENAVVSIKDISDQAIVTFSDVDNITKQINASADELLKNIEFTRKMLSEVTATSPSAVAAPVKLEMAKVFEGMRSLDFLMPGIIGIVLMFICFLLSSITIVQEKSRGTLLRTVLSPLTLPELLLGKTLGILTIAFCQGVILVLMAVFLFRVSISAEQLLPLFETVLVYSASFIAVGMVIATFADSENTAMLSALVLSIPMLFLCGVFYPFEMMPKIMVDFGNLLPITMGINIFKDILIYERTLALSDFFGLGAYFVLALAVAYLEMKKDLS